MASAARLTRDTLVFAAERNLLGIYSVKQRKYTAYQGPRMAEGILRLIRAREIVSYQGERRALPRLAAFLKLPRGSALHLRGTHVDLHRAGPARRRADATLAAAYRREFGPPPSFPRSAEGANRRAIHMTFRLWQHWRAGGPAGR